MGEFPGENTVPYPNPRKAGFNHSFFSPSADICDIVCYRLRRGEFFSYYNLYGSPPGRSFYSCKRNQNTLGALPQDPGRLQCWIRIDLRQEPKINPYCAQNRSQGSRRRICPFPPPPFPMAGKGLGWAGKCRAAVRCSGNVRTCEGGGSRWLGCGTMIGRKMSRRPMVMVSGAIGLQEKGGRSPPPKRGRLGGGKCVTDTF